MSPPEIEQERTKLFKTYSFLNLAAVLAAFVCGAVLTLVAGLKHADSSSQCQSVRALILLSDARSLPCACA